MAYNLPTVTNNNISFGPGVVKIGAVGATPSTHIGAIGEDGVTLEITSEKKYITQGNPKLNQIVFSQTQGAALSFSSLEWNMQIFRKALGAGHVGNSVDSAYGATGETFSFGGDPTPVEVALTVIHSMGVASHTIHLDMWRACSEAGFSIPFGQDEHSFEFKFVALATSTDWAGANLDTNNENLFRISRAQS
tara:strand:- start:28642 stop:29217 length:576 start_codon:yes stop_codon:yes gene_type:complete